MLKTALPLRAEAPRCSVWHFVSARPNDTPASQGKKKHPASQVKTSQDTRSTPPPPTMLASSTTAAMRRRLLSTVLRPRALLSTYSGGGGGNQSWMEAYPWANLTVGFLVGYAGTVFTERSILKPKQAALR